MIWEGSNAFIKAADIFAKSAENLKNTKSTLCIPKYWEGKSAEKRVRLLECYSAE